MRSIRKAAKDYLESYSPSDRSTFVLDGRSAFWYGICTGLGLPLVGVVGRKLGMNADMLALLMSAQFLGLLLNLWLGHLARCGDLVAYVFWPGFLARASLALVALVASPWAFLAVMAFYFVVSNLGGPAYSAIMRLNYSDRNRGRAMGHIRVMLQSVSAACSLAAGFFLQAWPLGFRILFPIAAAAGVTSSLIFRRVKPLRRSSENEASGAVLGAAPGSVQGGAPNQAGFRDSLALLARDRRFLVFMAIIFIVGFPDKMLISLEPIRLVDELGVGYGAAGLVLGAVPLAAAVLGYVLCSRLAGKIDPFLLLAATTILLASRQLGFALATSPAHLFPGVFLGGISNAGWDLLPLFAVILFTDEERLGLYMGLYFTLIGVRGIIGPAVGTWLYQSVGLSISSIYALSAYIEAAGAVLLLVFRAVWKGPSHPRFSGPSKA
jgi:MFS family permease